MRVRTQRVPVGYRELEYLESTGTQYIDTGVNLSSNNFKVECDFINTVNDYSREQAIFSIWTSTYLYWNVFIDYSKKIDLYTAGHTYGDIVTLKTKYNLSLTRNSNTWTLKLGDSTVTKIYSPSSINTTTLKIFTRGDVPSTSYSNTYIQMFYLKITIDGTLVRNLVPCERLSDNKPGMYDTVNSTFYTNQGTGEFIKGPYKDSYKVSLFPRLPLEYQEVEYIQSDGNQLVKIGSSDAKKYYVKQSFNQLGTGRYTLQGYSSTWYGTNDNSNYFQYADGNVIVNTSIQLNTNTIYEITLDSTGIKLNNTFFAYDQTKSKTWTKFGLFQIEDYPQFKFRGKVYNAKVFNEDNKMIKNFIPCYRKSDNVIGMYDIVEGKFYTNKGSGTFTKGNNANNTISCKIVGGSSDIYYGYNQIVFNGDFATSSLSGFNFVWNIKSYTLEDKILKFEQQSQYTLSGVAVNAQPIIGHKYYIGCDVISYNSSAARFVTGFGYQYASHITVPASGSTRYEVLLTKGSDTGSQYNYVTWGNNLANSTLYKWGIKNVMIIDLTDWYGAGKEPSTVQEFRNKFTQTYFPTQITPLQLTEYQINHIGPIYGYNQLLNLNGSSGQSGINFKAENNHITATGTCTGSFNVELTSFKFSLIDGHKYILTNYPQSMPISNLNYATIQLYTSGGPYYAILENDPTNYKMFTSVGSNGKQYYVRFRFENTKTYNMDYYCNLIDLTYWYGAGNEPTTVKEFKDTFYKVYYPTQTTVSYLNKYAINNL